MKWRRLFGKFLSGAFIVKGKVHPSFSQAGEDQVIRYLVNDCLQLNKPSYLEIGTHHPVFGNNTYYFYLRGSRGVCIEPDPRFKKLNRRYRSKDVFIQAGIGLRNDKHSDFYVFPKEYSGWNTFSKEEANKRKAETAIAYEVIQCELVTINDVIGTYFTATPNIVSIDVEGLDLDILQSLDFDKYRPDIICVESITFSNSNEQQKISEIANFMKGKNYFVFADTYVNTIFCRAEAFKKITR